MFAPHSPARVFERRSRDRQTLTERFEVVRRVSHSRSLARSRSRIVRRSRRTWWNTNRRLVRSSMPRDASRETAPWSAEEDELLLALNQKHGNRWSEIAKGMKTRSGQQCAQRWRHKVNPNIRRERWSAEEDGKVRRYRAHAGKDENVDVNDAHARLGQRRGGNRDQVLGAGRMEVTRLTI